MEMTKPIYTKPYYKPREIAELGLIKNRTYGDSVDSNYAFILELIKGGELKAENYGKGSRDYFLVPATEIKRYRKQLTK